jgi:hypothetical protein
MEDHTKHPHAKPDSHAGPGHETSDVNIWAIGKFGLALVILTILSIGLLIGVFRFFQTREATNAGIVDPTKLFPSPQLESSEPKNLGQYREEEQKLLTTYGWVDQQKGVVRVPIDQAIDMLAQRGLPVRQQQVPVRTVSVPSESGLGQPQTAGEGTK